MVKVGGHIPSVFSMSPILSCKSIEKNHDVYRGKDCRKKFCESLREHAIKLLTNKQQKWYENAKVFYISKEKFEDKHAKDT